MNEAKELSEMPEEVRDYSLNKKPIPHKQKTSQKPKPAKIDQIRELIMSQPELLQQPLLDFAADRIERKKPATTGAVKRWIAKLDKMYPNNYPMQVESIEQSIERGWSGMYEVKNNNRGSGGGEFL